MERHGIPDRRLTKPRPSISEPTATGQRLIQAAAALLDAGGDSAVTLRAVGNRAGVSHNAPYKHFANRSALLAAVAAADFKAIGRGFHAVAVSAGDPRDKLVQALRVVHAFSEQHPARYRLLFSDPTLVTEDQNLQVTAMEAFTELLAIVRECQSAKVVPNTPTSIIASLLFAATHGLIALESSGRIHPEKGLSDASSSIQLLVDLVSSR